MEMQKSNGKNASTGSGVVDGVESKGNEKAVGSGGSGGGKITPIAVVPPQTGASGKSIAAAASDDSKVGSKSPRSQSSSSSISSPIRIDRMLLLEDSTLETVPDYCSQMLAKIEHGKRSTQTDYLAFLIYCLALESGFVLPEILVENQKDLKPPHWASAYHAANIRKLAQIPESYLRFDGSQTIYRFTFAHCASNTKILCNLIGMQAGDLFVVTLTPDDDSPGRSICLPLSRYVLGLRLKTVMAKFRNLKELSYELKEQLFSPIRNYVMQSCDYELFTGLCGIPEEMVFLILNKLDMRRVQILSRTCRKMRELCSTYYNCQLNQVSRSTLSVSLFSRISDL